MTERGSASRLPEKGLTKKVHWRRSVGDGLSDGQGHLSAEK